MKKKLTNALLAVAMAAVLLTSAAIAAYYEKITLKGSVSLLIPEPSLSPSPSPSATPSPEGTSDYWIQVARDALRRATEDDALADELDRLADPYENGSQGTNAAWQALQPYWSMAANEEQRSWVQQASNQIDALHRSAVSANAAIAQIAGAIYIWSTDQYVNGWQTAEYEYSMCKQTDDATGHLNKLKTFALSAKAQADTEDARIAQAQAHLAAARKAAGDAWQVIEDLRQKFLAAAPASKPVGAPLLAPLTTDSPTPTTTDTPAPTEAATAPPTSTPAPTEAPTPAPTATPAPTQAPAPTEAPKPAMMAPSKPVLTDTPAPTPTQAPTPAPTAAPAPAPTPASTRAPAPTEAPREKVEERESPVEEP